MAFVFNFVADMKGATNFMGSPKIKDRLFHSQRTGCFFIAETTQNELIVKPSFFVLPQTEAQLCVAFTLVHVHMHV